MANDPLSQAIRSFGVPVPQKQKTKISAPPIKKLSRKKTKRKTTTPSTPEPQDQEEQVIVEETEETEGMPLGLQQTYAEQGQVGPLDYVVDPSAYEDIPQDALSRYTLSRPGTTATPVEQQQLYGRPIPEEAARTPMTSQQEASREFTQDRLRAESDAEQRITIEKKEYQQRVSDRYEERTAVDYREVGMEQQGGQWVFTDESQIQQLQQRGYTVETDEQGNITVYHPEYLKTIQQEESRSLTGRAREIYREEYAEEDIILVEKDGELLLVPRGQYEREQRVGDIKEDVRGRIAGEEGLGPQVLEGARFVSSLFIRPGDFGAMTAAAIGGDSERFLDVYAGQIEEFADKNIPELFLESYKPGGFGFLGTTAALTVGIGGAASGALAGAGAGGKILATGLPFVAAGAMGAVLGAELGITQGLENMGELPEGSTRELLGRRAAELGVAYGAGAAAALGTATPTKGIIMEEYPGSIGLRKTIGLGKYQRPITREYFILTDGKQIPLWGTGFEPTFPGVVPYTPKTPSTFVYNLLDPQAMVLFTGVPRTEPIVSSKGTPLEMQRPITYRQLVKGTGWEPDIETYIGKQLKQRDVPVDFMGTPKGKRVPTSYRKVVGTKRGIDYETYVGKMVEKEIGRSLSTKVLPKPMRWEPMLDFYAFTELGVSVFDTSPMVRLKPVVKRKPSRVIDMGKEFRIQEKKFEGVSLGQTQKSGQRTIQLQKQKVTQEQKSEQVLIQKPVTRKKLVSMKELEQMGRFDQELYQVVQHPEGEVASGSRVIQTPLVVPISVVEQGQMQGMDSFMGSMQGMMSMSLRQQMQQQGQGQYQNQLVSLTQASLVSPVQEQMPMQIQMQAQMQAQELNLQLKQQSIIENIQKGIAVDLQGAGLISSGEGGYDVFVKKRQWVDGRRVRGTEWEKLNKHALNEFDAKSLGSHKTDNTAKRTFKLVETDEQPRPLRKKVTPWDMQMLEYNRRGKDKYVEDVMFAIDSPGELDEITERGIAARTGRRNITADFGRVKGMGSMENRMSRMMRRSLI